MIYCFQGRKCFMSEIVLDMVLKKEYVKVTKKEVQANKSS